MVTKDLILTWRMHMVLKKAHYEVIMNDKVLSLIKEAEAHYQELEKDCLVRLMPFQSGRALNVPDGLSETPGNVPLPL